MKLKRLEIVWIIIAGCLGTAAWLHFSFPRFQSIDLSVHQSEASSIARDFLKNKGVNPDEYQSAVIFAVDSQADRYLQKTLGIAESQALLKKLNFDLFYWTVRFFKEKQKEEFKVSVSSRTGEVIRFDHDIEDTAARPDMGKEEAKAAALEFLKTKFNFDPSLYTSDREDAKKFDHRTDYSFSWQANHIDIPWEGTRAQGSAKLMTSVGVSGGDILYFHKMSFDIPEGFSRHIGNLKQTGENLTLFFRLFYLGLLTIAIMMVVNRKNHMVPRLVRGFYVRIGIVLFACLVLEVFNSFQYVMFAYPTTQSLSNYLVRESIENLINPFFMVIAFILPGLAGEALRYETAHKHKTGGFLTYIQSSFYTKPVAAQIGIAYATAAVILGLQGIVFAVGYKYWGVWDELSWLSQSSTTVVPAFTALMIGLHAAFGEEITFRLFALNLFRSWKLATGAAIIISSLLWGFGHTGYAVFPMWFRGVEVTVLGLVLAGVYVRYGIIAAIAAHFLMDAFLLSLPYLLQPQWSFNFVSSVLVLGLPLLGGIVALVINHSTHERPTALKLSAQQQFNYNLLIEILRQKSPQERVTLKHDLIKHGWDPAVVERASQAFLPSEVN